MTYFFANWKMYLNYHESVALLERIAQEVKETPECTFGVFPNFLAIDRALALLKDSPVAVGAQNASWTPQGAYTGAVSAFLLKEMGCTYALIGHSERRYIFGENDDDVRKKLEACFDVGLIPVLCIGETQEDLDENKREYRLKKQLMKALFGLAVKSGELIIAYEPVWAIGTGTPCDPTEAADIHEWIKTEVRQYTDATVPLLYGGSVAPENAPAYVAYSAIDGVLVGSASAKAESFFAIASALRPS